MSKDLDSLLNEKEFLSLQKYWLMKLTSRNGWKNIILRNMMNY